jgi:hypothetical protein
MQVLSSELYLLTRRGGHVPVYFTFHFLSLSHVFTLIPFLCSVLAFAELLSAMPVGMVLFSLGPSLNARVHRSAVCPLSSLFAHSRSHTLFLISPQAAY